MGLEAVGRLVLKEGTEGHPEPDIGQAPGLHLTTKLECLETGWGDTDKFERAAEDAGSWVP